MIKRRVHTFGELFSETYHLLQERNLGVVLLFRNNSFTLMRPRNSLKSIQCYLNFPPGLCVSCVLHITSKHKYLKVDVLTSVNQEWENKLKQAFRKGTEEAALRLQLEHEVRSCLFVFY